MLIHNCARGPGTCSTETIFDKNGMIRCILSVPKYAIINLKINNSSDNKSTTPNLCHILTKINPDAHVSTKKNTFTFYKGGFGGNSPPPPLEGKEMLQKKKVFLFLHQILHTRRVDSPVMMWIQICASTMVQSDAF